MGCKCEWAIERSRRAHLRCDVKHCRRSISSMARCIIAHPFVVRWEPSWQESSAKQKVASAPRKQSFGERLKKHAQCLRARHKSPFTDGQQQAGSKPAASDASHQVLENVRRASRACQLHGHGPAAHPFVFPTCLSYMVTPQLSNPSGCRASVSPWRCRA